MVTFAKKVLFPHYISPIYVGAECYIKYSEMYFVCKEAHEISHVGWDRFDWHLNEKAN